MDGIQNFGEKAALASSKIQLLPKYTPGFSTHLTPKIRERLPTSALLIFGLTNISDL